MLGSRTAPGLLALLLALAGGGCSDEPAPAPISCGATLGDRCIGVTPGPLCDAELCTEGVPCQAILGAHDDAELAVALSQAGEGSCIALAAGSYAEVALPAGVSLLGHGADDSFVARLTVPAGSGVVVRGVTVDGGGVTVSGASARFEAVRVRGGPDGIRAEAQASLELVGSEIIATELHGLVARDVASVTIRQSIVADAGGPGVWIACTDGCACAERPLATLDHVRIERAHHVASAFFGAIATLTQVELLDTTQYQLDEGGGGLVAAQCSELGVTGLTLVDADSFGILVSDSSASLAGTVSGSLGGLWVVASAPTAVAASGLHLAQNRGIGIGLSGAGAELALDQCSVTGTSEAIVPVEELGSAAVGYGMMWSDGATAQLSGVSFAASARLPLLIDGPVGPGSSLSTVTLDAIDGAAGVHQQNQSQADPGLSIGDSVPPINHDAGTVAELALPPTAPGAL